MKNKISKIVWGLVLISFGVVIGLNVLGVTDIDIFFDGWWTFLIIIPCFIGFIFDPREIGNLIGLAIGICLLLCTRDIIEFSTLWKLLLPIIIIIVGLKMIFGGLFGNRGAKMAKKLKTKLGDKETKSANGIFSGAELNFSGEVFEGAELNAVFGGAKCDLRGAIFEGDCFIDASSVFGGIDIYLPDDVNVKISSTSIFGGVDNKRKKNTDKSPYTIYINAVCVFGGVDIK